MDRTGDILIFSFTHSQICYCGTPFRSTWGSNLRSRDQNVWASFLEVNNQNISIVFYTFIHDHLYLYPNNWPHVHRRDTLIIAIQNANKCHRYTRSPLLEFNSLICFEVSILKGIARECIKTHLKDALHLIELEAGECRPISSLLLLLVTDGARRAFPTCLPLSRQLSNNQILMLTSVEVDRMMLVSMETGTTDRMMLKIVHTCLWVQLMRTLVKGTQNMLINFNAVQ